MWTRHLKLFNGRRPARLILLLVLGAVGGGVVGWYALLAPPKRFAEVVPGKIYRSGEVSPRTLAQVSDRYGIRTVLSLLNPEAPETQAERAAAERLGLEWVNVPLKGDGSSEADDRERIRAIMLDEGNRPLLVHCSAGVNRTGLAVGLYRIHAQGWTYPDVLAELRANDFDDLPKHENLRAALQSAADGEAAAGR